MCRYEREGCGAACRAVLSVREFSRRKIGMEARMLLIRVERRLMETMVCPSPFRQDGHTTAEESATAAPDAVQARAVFMAGVGGFAMVRGGRLVEVDGRVLWGSLEALSEDAGRGGVSVSPLVIDTTPPSAAAK